MTHQDEYNYTSDLREVPWVIEYSPTQASVIHLARLNSFT